MHFIKVKLLCTVNNCFFFFKCSIKEEEQLLNIFLAFQSFQIRNFFFRCALISIMALPQFAVIRAKHYLLILFQCMYHRLQTVSTAHLDDRKPSMEKFRYEVYSKSFLKQSWPNQDNTVRLFNCSNSK